MIFYKLNLKLLSVLFLCQYNVYVHFDSCIKSNENSSSVFFICLLYTSDAADDMQCVDLGGRRIIKKWRVSRSWHQLVG